MTLVVDHKNGKTFSSATKILEPKQLKVALSPLAWKILKMLAEKPSYPKEIGKKLKMHEQKIYYHIKNLEKAGLIEKLKEEKRQGALAKFYTLTDSAFTVLLKPLEESQKIFQLKKLYKRFLEPFISEGKLDALTILGSPEPHGATKARAKDGAFATDLGLFLGSFLIYRPEIPAKLDTEVKEKDLKNNLIIIGGPGVNSITARVNNKLPIKFERKKHMGNFYSSIYSSISKKNYAEEGCGIVIKTKNPFDKTKDILIIAGRRISGTRAAILAFLQKFDELCKGNSYDSKIFARVLEGVDEDSDGVIDSIEFLE
ncbi:MAG: S-layer protein [Candidatus Aenigmarchaeota archaeon]|nr:S-layer protein [Candidatus Aenigmarchaeota archaeon]